MRSGLRPDQPTLLHAMAGTVTTRAWHRPSVALELARRATEPSAHHSMTLAVLALLVRDHLDSRAIATRSAPFAGLVPLEQLGRGADAR